MRNFKFKKQNKVNVRLWSPVMRIVSWILILSFFNLLTGCMNYFKVRKSNDSSGEAIERLYMQDKKLILHFEGQAWVLEVPEVQNNTLHAMAKKRYIAKLTKPVKKDRPNRFIIKSPYNQYDVLNEVHIYTNELSKGLDDKITVPLSAISNIDIYEFDKGATNGSAVLGAIGGFAASMGGFFLILLMTSCPFIYVPVDDTFALVGEIYSGSVQPPLERHDYLKLPNQNSDNSLYQLKIANELKESQHTNLMELWVFNHDKDADIVVDKYGKAYQLKNILAPVKAINFEGDNVLDEVIFEDEKFYTSTKYLGELALTDGIIAEFQNLGEADFARVKIHAKNNLLLDYMIGEFYDEMGNWYKPWSKIQKKAPEEKQRNWTLNQHIPMTLSVERNGNWETIDYYHIVGPMAMKEDVLSFPLNGTESNPLKIKLEFGNFFWDIDYLGVDFGDNENIEFQKIEVNTAINQDNKNVTRKLTSDDNKYYTQEFAGTSALVSFNLPPKTGEKQSIYLHSKGWYEILRNPQGEQDREYLETFKEPGRFNEFVINYVQRLASGEN
jgi:hypothetical protein